MSWLPLNPLFCWQVTLTLLHVSWIGLVIGLIAAFFNRLLRDRAAQSSRLFPRAAALQFSEVSRGADGTRSVPATLNANRRYWVNFISLLLFAASLPVTFVIVRSMTGEVPAAFGNAKTLVAEQASSTPSIVEEPTFSTPPQDDDAFVPVPPQGLSTAAEIPAAAPSPTVIPTSPSLWERLHSISRTAAPFVVILYAIGVAMMFVKLAFSVRVSRRLRSGSRPISDAHILARMAEQAKKLSLRIVPVIACCEQTAVPIVVGVLRPMILIPAAMVNGLTIEQLEFVLTHELAHLRRRDHWMIVVQRVLEAILFFHPVTWYLSHRIHDDRETSCDDLVLSLGGDRLQYAQSLLRVAELRLAGQSHQNHIALAADGQRPSKLRQRIARLLGESEVDSVRVSSVWLMVTVLGFLMVGIVSLSSTIRPAFAVVQDSELQEAKKERSEALDQEAVLQFAGKVCDRFSAINTAHVRFRFSIPNGTIRKGLTQEKVRTLLEENDLASEPDNLRKLLMSIFVDEETVPDKPWDDIELFRDGKGSSRRVRITTSSSDHGPDYWVGGGNGSLHWDAQNFQMNIPSELDVKLNDKLTTFLMSFLTSPNRLFLYLKQSQAEEVYRERDEIVLQYPGRYSDVEIVRLDATVGYLNSFGRYHHYGMIPGIVQQETLELGWRQLDDEIWLPTVVAQLEYRYGELGNCQFTVIDHAIFNQPLPDGIFQLGAPAGAVISDKRSGLHQKYTINRDVFDASSDEQLAAAREPLSGKLTDIEVSGVAVATSHYRIDDGVALKRIGPSFQLARSYVSRMLGNRSVDSLRGISRLLRQNGTRVELQHAEEGRAITAKELATFLKIADSAEIDGDEDLLELAIPGDFVFREGANKVDLIRNLQEIVTDEAQTPVTVEFRNAERTVYRATGEIKLKLRNGYSGIQMNAGLFGHFSDRINTGNLDSFLQNLSTYIDSRVVNAVEPTSEQLKWSERFYRIDPTKPTELVRIDPAVVLEQITEQMGIRFTEEKQVVPVLFIERVKEERSTVDAGKPLSGEKSNHEAIPEQQVVKPTNEFIRTDGDGRPIADGQAKATRAMEKASNSRPNDERGWRRNAPAG